MKRLDENSIIHSPIDKILIYRPYKILLIEFSNLVYMKRKHNKFNYDQPINIYQVLCITKI